MFDLLVRLAATVDSGGVSAAAKVLHISQPAVTKSLNQLEEHYGVPLLTRTKKGIVLTEYGEVAYRLSKLLIKSINDTESEISVKQDFNEKRLTIGAGLLWCYRYLPDALSCLVTRLPELGISVILKPPQELHDMVCNGDLDIGVGQMPDKTVPGIVYEELLVSSSAVFSHFTHPIRAQRSINEKHLGDYPWISFTVRDKDVVTTITGTKGSQTIKIDNLMLACMLMQKGAHLMWLPEPLAPVVEKFGIEPLIKYKAAGNEFISGLFYRESAMLRTSSREAITEIRKIVDL